MTKLRLILFPLSVLYIFVTEIRNFLFRINVLKSKQFPVPIINVGNLTVGGTGKTPMVLWLAEILSQNGKSVAIVSRGYGRKTKGFYWVENASSPEDVGDEPLLFKQANSEYTVAVCEKRVEAIDTIIKEKKVDVVILDDAYQHQYVKPSLNILLSDYSRPFYKDFVLPAGNLRELRTNKNRADVIITSKCPDSISATEKERILQKVNASETQKTFFSSLKYSSLNALFGSNQINFSDIKDKSVILITGIAKPIGLKNEVSKHCNNISHLKFADHHSYSKKDVENILKTANNDTVVITTTKDAIKLSKFSELKNVSLYALPVKPVFDDKKTLKELILNHVI